MEPGDGFKVENQWLLPDRIMVYAKDPEVFGDELHGVKLDWDQGLKKTALGGARSAGGWNYLCPATDPAKISPATRNPLRLMAEGRFSDAELAKKFACGRTYDEINDSSEPPVLMLDHLRLGETKGDKWETEFLPTRLGGNNTGGLKCRREYIYADGHFRGRWGTYDGFLSELHLDK